MKPALSEWEWHIVKLRRANKPIGGKVRGYVDPDEWSEDIRLAVAAQCLYGYLTRADVKYLRELSGFVLQASDLTELADRIAVLLPPEP